MLGSPVTADGKVVVVAVIVLRADKDVLGNGAVEGWEVVLIFEDAFTGVMAVAARVTVDVAVGVYTPLATVLVGVLFANGVDVVFKNGVEETEAEVNGITVAFDEALGARRLGTYTGRTVDICSEASETMALWLTAS